MTVTYDSASFTYDASNLTYEGVASFTKVLSYTATSSFARSQNTNSLKALAFSASTSTGRVVAVGMSKAATASASFSLVRQAALTRLYSAVLTAQDTVLTAARDLAYTVTAALSAVKTAGYARTLSTSLTAASTTVRAMTKGIVNTVTVASTRVLQAGKPVDAQVTVGLTREPLTVGKLMLTTIATNVAHVINESKLLAYTVISAFAPAKTTSKTPFATTFTLSTDRTNQTNKPLSASVTGTASRNPLAIGKPIGLTVTVTTVAEKLRGRVIAFVINVTNALTKTFGWTSTAALSGAAVLEDHGVKVMDAAVTIDGSGLLVSAPEIPGAARDIARDGTHDQAVLTYDRNGNQLYLPVRPTSTL